MIKKNEITIVLISHNSKELVIQFIKNFSKKIKFLIIDNSNDQNLKDSIEVFSNVEIKLMENKLIGVRETHRLVITIEPEKWRMGQVIKKL